MVVDNKDQFLRSCLVMATHGTSAFAHVDTDLSGYEILSILKAEYGGEDFIKDKAIQACKDLSVITFGKDTTMTADAFVSKFISCLMKMKWNGTLYPKALVKPYFLSKVKPIKKCRTGWIS